MKNKINISRSLKSIKFKFLVLIKNYIYKIYNKFHNY
jgi:hypothetical protein